MQRETEKRATYFFVASLRKERIWLLRTQKGTPENESFQKTMDGFKLNLEKLNEGFIEKATEQLNSYNETLASQAFENINSEFESFRMKNRREPEWYALLGIKSVRLMAKSVDRLHEYDVFYSGYSNVMHGSSHTDQIQISKGKLSFSTIRSLKHISEVLTFTISNILRIYEQTLTYYRPTELPAYRLKYVEDWRTAFINIKDVHYTVVVK